MTSPWAARADKTQATDPLLALFFIQFFTQLRSLTFPRECPGKSNQARGKFFCEILLLIEAKETLENPGYGPPKESRYRKGFQDAEMQKSWASRDSLTLEI
jgi:hypothetical protein